MGSYVMMRWLLSGLNLKEEERRVGGGRGKMKGGERMWEGEDGSRNRILTFLKKTLVVRMGAMGVGKEGVILVVFLCGVWMLL